MSQGKKVGEGVTPHRGVDAGRFISLREAVQRLRELEAKPKAKPEAKPEAKPKHLRVVK